VKTLVLVIAVVVLVGSIILGIVYTAIKSDLTVIVRRMLQRAVEVEVAVLLPAEDRATYIEWEKGDVGQMRRDGGSGIGVQLWFLVLTIPRAAIRVRLARRTERS
jgi:hypothetical protein